MFDLMQKHRRAVMIFVLIFVGAPMAIFFGVPSPFGGDPAYEDMTRTVIEVYDQPVDAGTFVNQYASMVDGMRASGQPVPTAADLVKNQTVDNMIRGLINDALLTHEVKDKGYRPDREYLEERLKEFSIFKDSQGNFNSGYYNQWVTAQINAGMDWNGIWDMVAEQVKRDLYVAMITGSGRVLDAEVRRRYEEDNTRIRVRYILVEPPIEPTEETITLYHEQNKDKYRTEPQVHAVTVAFNIKPEQPEIVKQIIEKARAGEDFAALAVEHSKASSRVDGGEMGWTPESETLPEFRKAIFRMAVGEISDPVDGPLGTYIYKVEEQRTDEVSGVREVRAREIVIPSRLEPEALAQVRARAQELLQQAQTAGGLKAAAEAAGLTPVAIGPFDRMTIELTGIEPVDAARLRMQLAESPIGLVTELIQGTNNLFVAEVTQIDPDRVKTLEEAREEVVTEWEGNYKLTPEYAEQLSTLVGQISTNLGEFKTLNEILEAFPEITTKVQSTRLFGPTDYLFDHGWFIEPSSLHAVVQGKEPGALAGPVRDFRNQVYFVELLERQAPTEEMWESDWPTKREQIREMAYAGLRDERMADYLQHQLEIATESAQVFLDSDTMFALLGVDPNAQPEATGEALPMNPDAELPTATPQMTPPVGGAPMDHEDHTGHNH